MDTSLRKPRKSTLVREVATARSVQHAYVGPLFCDALPKIARSARSHLVSSRHFLLGGNALERFGSTVVALGFSLAFSPDAGTTGGVRYPSLNSSEASQAPVTIPVGARDIDVPRAKTSPRNLTTVFVEGQPEPCASRRMKGRPDLR